MGVPGGEEADETAKSSAAPSPAKSINIDGTLVDLALWKHLGKPTNEAELNLAKRKAGVKVEKQEDDERGPQSVCSSCFCDPSTETGCAARCVWGVDVLRIGFSRAGLAMPVKAEGEGLSATQFASA